MDINTYYDFLIEIGKNYQSAFKSPSNLVDRLMYKKEMKDFCLKEEDVNLYNKITSKFKVRYKGELEDLASLNNDEIILLFKGFVIIENIGLYNGGSVSAAIQIYNHITRRRTLDRSQITMITDWSLRHAKNPYIPFGMSNRGSSLIDHIRKDNEYTLNKSKESLYAQINKMNKRFKGFENKITQLENEKAYLRSIISEINEEDVLEARKRVISKRKGE